MLNIKLLIKIKRLINNLLEKIHRCSVFCCWDLLVINKRKRKKKQFSNQSAAKIPVLSSLTFNKLALNHLTYAAVVLLRTRSQYSITTLVIEGTAVNKICPSLHIPYECDAWRPTNTKLVI